MGTLFSIIVSKLVKKIVFVFTQSLSDGELVGWFYSMSNLVGPFNA